MFRPAEYPVVDGLRYEVTLWPTSGHPWPAHLLGPWRINLCATDERGKSDVLIVRQAALTSSDGDKWDLVEGGALSAAFSAREGNSNTLSVVIPFAKRISPRFEDDQRLTLRLGWTIMAGSVSNDYQKDFSFVAFRHRWSGFVFRPEWDRSMRKLERHILTSGQSYR